MQLGHQDEETDPIPKDKEAAAVKELSNAAWYKDECGGAANLKQQEEEFADEELMYNQDADKSVKTIHEKKGGNKVYRGSPNAPTFSVGRPMKFQLEKKLEKT